MRFVQCRAEEAVDRADDAVEVLQDLWDPGQLALLTTKNRHPVQVEMAQGERWRGHVLGFKGLERQAVVLAVNGFKQPERAKEMLYVGLSRARTQLVVCGDLAEIAAVGGEGVRRRLVDAEQSQP